VEIIIPDTLTAKSLIIEPVGKMKHLDRIGRPLRQNFMPGTFGKKTFQEFIQFLDKLRAK
jgi:hypothetical protein